MSAEESKALIRRLFEEVLNGGKMDVVDEVISTEYVEHAATPVRMPVGRRVSSSV